MKTLVALIILSFGLQAQAKSGAEECQDKKMFLKQICKVQELVHGTAHFSTCSSGYSYYVETGASEGHSALSGDSVSCKIVELRNEKSIDRRTTYFDEHSNKVVVYDHTNGLSNTYVYGHTGYYHISEMGNGDNLYNFYSF